MNLVGELYGAWQELRLYTERSGGFHGSRRSLDEVVAARTLHDGISKECGARYQHQQYGVVCQRCVLLRAFGVMVSLEAEGD